MAVVEERATVDVRLLGPLELRAAGVRANGAIRLGGPRQRTLLGLLALRAPHVVSRARLIDGIWDDGPPPAASKTLLAHVAHVRRTLTNAGLDGLIRTTPPGYVLTAEPDQIDAHRFADLVRRGRATLTGGSLVEAAHTLSTALQMWRGEILEDCPIGEWVRAEVATLREARAYAAEDLLTARIWLGEHQAAAAELAGLVAREPLRERLWELLMVALYRCSRQAEALDAFHRARAVLAEELGVEPGPALRAAQAAILAGDDRAAFLTSGDGPAIVARGGPAATGAGGDGAGGRVRGHDPTGTLPAPLTSLVGRETETAAIGGVLDGHRLVTLTGIGGCGKTRLAIAVARDVAARFTSGVRFVDLAAVTAARSVPAVVAAALGLREQAGVDTVELLAHHVRPTRLLLVLDNCEHLVDGCAALADALLSHCPDLYVLTTSREALGVPGEVAWPVPTLAVPTDGGAGGLAAVRRFAAVQLFLDRAAVPAVRALTDADATALAAICVGLDGLPLAIELAAGRTSVLTTAEIAERLRDPSLLRAPHGHRRQHEALDATMAWSYGLLAPRARSRFRRLAVFTAGFTLDAVRAVWGCTEEQALDELSGLIARSLVVTEHRGGGARYRLLETIRHYAARRLAASGDEPDARRAHAVHFLRLAEEVGGTLSGPELESLLDRLAHEEENLVAALAWLSEHGSGTEELRLATALARYFHIRGRYRDGRLWLDRALHRGSGAPAGDRARGVCAAAYLALFECDYAAAERHGTRALATYRSLGDGRGVGRTLCLLASVDRERGHYETARAQSAEAIEAYRVAGDEAGVADATQSAGFVAWLTGNLLEAEQLMSDAHGRYLVLDEPEGIASTRVHLAAVAHYRGQSARARWLAEDALARCSRLEFKEGIAWAYNILGLIELCDGYAVRARSALRASLEVHGEVGDRWRCASVLEALAAVLVTSMPTMAVELLSAGSALRDGIGAPVPPQERRAVDATVDAAHRAVNDQAFYRAWARGELLRLPELLERLTGE